MNPGKGMVIEFIGYIWALSQLKSSNLMGPGSIWTPSPPSIDKSPLAPEKENVTEVENKASFIYLYLF